MHIGVTPILRPQGERHLGDQEIPVTAARGAVEEDAESRVRRELGAECCARDRVGSGPRCYSCCRNPRRMMRSSSFGYGIPSNAALEANSSCSAMSGFGFASRK